MRVDIYIGGDKLDLFADENIDVVSSVADIEDITKNTTDYTKTFTVPASKINNILFKHWYNATVDNSFDARIKVDGEIKLDGMLFRFGKFRLSKVSVKKGYPSSYTINFWGNLVSLKDVLGKDELSDLDLSAFDHSYNSANVFTGLVSSGFMSGLVYTLLAKKQYYYNSDVTDTTTSDTLTNISYGDGSGSNGVAWNDLRPSLRLIKIIEAIETDYSLTFSRDFFGRTEFNDLYLWLNKNKDKTIGGNTQTIDWDGGSANNINLTTNIGSYATSNTAASNDDFYWFLHTTITPSAGYENVPYTIKAIVDDNEFSSVENTGTQTTVDVLRVQNAPSSPHTYTIYWEVSSGQEFKYTSSVWQRHHQSGTVINTYTTTATESTITSSFTTSDNVPKIKIIDFLKGLFKMFKLVVIPQNDGSLYIDTFNSFYASGQVYNVSDYIDHGSYDVERGKILNEINYLFSEPQTILNKQFEENTRIAYGDSEVQLKDSNDVVLDGDKLEFTLPFEQILYERLTDQVDSTLTDIQYGAIVDENIDAVNPKPVIHYNILQSLGGAVVGFINDSGAKDNLFGSLNTATHTDVFESPNFSTLFDAEFSTWNGQKINNTLYSNYHSEYIESIFNVKKRSFKYKAKNLPLRIMLDLQLNDLLKVKDTFYRIDKFTSNLLNGEVSLDLVNSFTDTINSFSASPSSFFITYDAQQVSSYITNLDAFTTVKTDQGFGIGWVTITNTGGNMYFDVDENTSALPRDILITVTNTATLQETTITINQSGVGALLNFSEAVNSQYIPTILN